MPLKELSFITGNRNKLAEVQAILGDIISLKSQSLNLTEIQGSIEDIALDKCRRAAEIVREEKGGGKVSSRTLGMGSVVQILIIA